MDQWAIQREISYGRLEYLDDLEYVDDLALLICTQAHIRDKIDKIWLNAMRLELEINAPKTKVVFIN